MREKTAMKRQPGTLSVPALIIRGEGRGEGGEGQGPSLDIESFDSEVKGTAGKAMGTSGQGWAGGG